MVSPLAAAARPALRAAARLPPRRLGSSGSDAAAKARQLQARAQQGLSRVSAAAGAARRLSAALGSFGGRTAKVVAYVERTAPLPSRARAAPPQNLPSVASDPPLTLPPLPPPFFPLFFSPGQTPVVIYYAKVGVEVAKLVFQGQKMSPP